jgi:hypothetical protein
LIYFDDISLPSLAASVWLAALFAVIREKIYSSGAAHQCTVDSTQIFSTVHSLLPLNPDAICITSSVVQIISHGNLVAGKKKLTRDFLIYPTLTAGELSENREVKNERN